MVQEPGGHPEQERPDPKHPARQWNDPPGAKLVDVQGLLLVAAIVLAGIVVAVLVVRFHH